MTTITIPGNYSISLPANPKRYSMIVNWPNFGNSIFYLYPDTGDKIQYLSSAVDKIVLNHTTSGEYLQANQFIVYNGMSGSLNYLEIFIK
jgi:hypothetical protein